MIRPQTQVYCLYDCGGVECELCAPPQATAPKPPPKEVGDFSLFTSPPPPTLAEIERLVDALEDTVRPHGYMGCERRLNREARAALMAAIRAYGRE